MAAKPARKPAPDIAAVDFGAQPWRTMVEDAADPDRPNVTILRRRVRDPIRTLVRKGELDHAHWIAAERFRDCHALAEGAREEAPGGSPTWSRCYPQAQLDAIAERKGAIQAVGLRLGGVFVAMVLEHEGAREYETRCRLRNGRAVDLIVEALDSLIAYYG
jgi:hypothetical protein